MYVFIDESGDHNLMNLEPQFKVFTLVAVCIEKNEYEEFDVKFKELKSHFFNRYSYVLHTAEINRPSKSKDNSTKKFSNASFRESFYNKINTLLEETNFKIISCTVKKDEYIKLYSIDAVDPYEFGLENIINQILFKLRPKSCYIFPEKRNDHLDAKIDLAFSKYKTVGTKYYSGDEIKRVIKRFKLESKKENITGLQLADLVATPLSRNIAGYKPKLNGHEISYEIISKKIMEHSNMIFP